MADEAAVAPAIVAVVVNAARVDFEGDLDLNSIRAVARVVLHNDDHPSEDVLVQRVVDASATIVITKEIPVPRSAIARLPTSVRLICEAGTGFNNIDIVAAREMGILVCNVPDYSSTAVAQLVLAFLLNHSVSLPAQQHMLSAGDRRNFTDRVQVPLFELQGKTIGLVGGRGTIGRKVTELCLALGMRVIVSSRHPVAASNGDDPRVEITTSLGHLLAASDFVSLHCPLTNETRNLIDAAALTLMKPTAYLINTARGGMIDQDALITALAAGTIAGAALDVQAEEPPPADCPLYTLPNVCLTPHIGWERKESRQRLLDAVASNMKAFVDGEPRNIVN